jgi:hypothetical protein
MAILRKVRGRRCLWLRFLARTRTRTPRRWVAVSVICPVDVSTSG